VKENGWVGHVAWMGWVWSAYTIFARKSGGKRLLGRRSVGGKITLEWILNKEGVRTCTGFVLVGIRSGQRVVQTRW